MYSLTQGPLKFCLARQQQAHTTRCGSGAQTERRGGKSSASPATERVRWSCPRRLIPFMLGCVSNYELFLEILSLLLDGKNCAQKIGYGIFLLPAPKPHSALLKIEQHKPPLFPCRKAQGFSSKGCPGEMEYCLFSDPLAPHIGKKNLKPNTTKKKFSALRHHAHRIKGNSTPPRYILLELPFYLLFYIYRGGKPGQENHTSQAPVGCG